MEQKKFKYFDVETDKGTFHVKTSAQKVTEQYFSVNALHYIKRQHNVVANKVISVKDSDA